MTYVEGFLTPVPTANKDEYVAHARKAADMIKANGATRFVETWGDDVPRGQDQRSVGRGPGQGRRSGPVQLVRISRQGRARRRQ